MESSLTQQVSKMLLYGNALMNEYFNLSMIENSKVKEKRILFYLVQVAQSILGALVATKRRSSSNHQLTNFPLVKNSFYHNNTF